MALSLSSESLFGVVIISPELYMGAVCGDFGRLGKLV